MRKILLFATIALVLCGCRNRTGKMVDNYDTATDEVTVSDMHNARNSLDYYGTYRGVLPCADCEGIETMIELDRDDNYTLTTKYLGTGDTYITEGKYKWDSQGNVITLHGDDEPGRKFKVQENELLHLDIEGNIITGDHAQHYILKKL